MQSKNKNVRNELPPRYRRYCEFKRHLRGTPRPEVFPIGGTNQEDTRNVGEDLSYAIDANYHKGTNTLEKGRRQLIQLNQPTHSNDRVYSDKGLSPTLNTMQGGNRQPFIRNPYNGKTSEVETGTLGTTCGTTTGKTAQHLYKDSKIRRLTPKECERLQGFPDDWTEKGIDKDGNEVYISDTQRYRSLGNAVTINVIKEIICRLVK